MNSIQIKKKDFLVSVIIPVYNAAPFLGQAVQSAEAQEETGEVILIEDGSRDDSLEVCRMLESRYDRVKLLQHPDHQNHGAGASRNLGLENAQYDYIAFLDADDFYLPGRFSNDIKTLEGNSDIDGIYNAIGSKNYDQNQNSSDLLTTIHQEIKPADLFYNLGPIGGMGFFHGNGLTLKKRVFDKVGFFNTELELSQDTHMWIKLAAVCQLLPGQLQQPVAMRGVHPNNRSSNKEKLEYFRPLLFKSLILWGLKKNIGKDKIDILWSLYYKWFFKVKNFTGIPPRTLRLKMHIDMFLKSPSIISIQNYRKTFPFLSKILVG